MSRQWTPLCGVVTTLALAAAAPPAMAQDQPSTGIETVVVTAQKVSQNINDVGMSITAASGDELTKLGITDTSQLVKVVPGFNYTPSFYGTPIYTIRGVGFLDTSLAASPTVSVYNDEVPLPYSIMTSAASLDIQRVEVLKGPQGTLFGENAGLQLWPLQHRRSARIRQRADHRHVEIPCGGAQHSERRLAVQLYAPRNIGCQEHAAGPGFI